MPGPGGGGRGGGFGGRGSFGGSSGGSFGGGRPGGGFGGRPGGFDPGPGGPHHRPPRRHFGGFWFWPRRYYYGGGYYGGGGGFFGFLILPIIMLVIVSIVLIASVGSAFSNLASGGVVEFDNEKLNDYADEQYGKIFGASSAYEDNILIVFVTGEDYYDYAYIAWVGDHIKPAVTDLYGNNNTELGRAMDNRINQSSYKYSLDTDLARVITDMKLPTSMASDGEPFDYYCDDMIHVQVDSTFVNNTDLPMTAASINTALEGFTLATGISVAVVVEDAEDVFGKTMPVAQIIIIVVCLLLIALSVFLIVRGIKRRRGRGNGPDGDNGSNTFHDMYGT